MITDKEIKYNKIWITKDKYIFRHQLGPHWYLKKFLTLWKYFIVERKEITSETLKEIGQLFQTFVDKIDNATVRKDAEVYFFSPKDFRQPKTIIDFEKFNDDDKQEMNARKLFIVYLMGIGGQAGIKKMVMSLFSEKDITVSKIIEEIPKMQEALKEEAEKKGEDPSNSCDDPILTVLSDTHAEIRNYRQLLSYRGIVPPEEDGYTLNEIGKLVCSADSLLIMVIWEHQKIKFRYSNPYTRRLRTDNATQKYKTVSDFEDFKVNNYVALIQTLHELYLQDKNNAYISFEDYKLFICREVPFNVKSVVKKILQFRKLSKTEQEKQAAIFNKRPKTRQFSINKPKSSSEDFLKELANLIYGIFQYKYTSKKANYNNLLKYENQILVINNFDLFEIFAEYMKNIHHYILAEYEELYARLARYASLKQIDEILESESQNEEYRKKLILIRKEYLKKDEDDLKDFYQKTLNAWNRYISSVDDKLLIYTYACVLVLDNYNDIKNKKSLSDFVHKKISKEFVDIVGIEEKKLNGILERIIFDIIKKQPLTKIKETDLVNNRNLDLEAEKWLETELEDEDMSALKERLKKEQSDTIYSRNSKGQRERKRDGKMMKLVEKERMDMKIIMGEKRKNYPVKQCDICENEFEFGKGEPQCHHMVPFEYYGPDHELNYAFLCKKCHKIFTHDEYSEKAKNAIDKLKLKGLVKREYFENMIREDLLHLDQIKYLHKTGYIHTIQFLELVKMRRQRENLDELDNFEKKTMPSGERWTRAMYGVYVFRNKFNLVMEDKIEGVYLDVCDGCDTPFKKSEPECHHIIPKAQKFQGKAPEGPESPYNYAYLCFICHQKFTSRKPERIEIVKRLKQKELVTKKTIKKMILHDGLTQLQLDYLQAESYIDETEHKELLDLIQQMESYLK